MHFTTALINHKTTDFLVNFSVISLKIINLILINAKNNIVLQRLTPLIFINRNN